MAVGSSVIMLKKKKEKRSKSGLGELDEEYF